jgi:hypothetical protein
MTNFKVSKIFIWVEKFFLFIFQSPDLREKRESHRKIIEEREICVLAKIHPLKRMTFISIGFI